ncbi:hypothetical protein G6321_00046175 [Bradyrhizobium barranii subsp. barranii]|uniref:Uncharacterized protein n=1 Tax=Bradyrhizobium barranii subsp. barranii TaxID=2823807 RepID=A0A7Z0QAV5_9BRAD|nr:hypothetical protein [Bradyrhizobium barranii]UGX92939.1 hypothetical protein G6321_00046175 [Bradyrhizobium barranii subsp. barranii]
MSSSGRKQARLRARQEKRRAANAAKRPAEDNRRVANNESAAGKAFFQSKIKIVATIFGVIPAVIAVWGTFAKTSPTVTLQGWQSSSSVLQFKIDNPSFIFDMRDVTLACHLLKADVNGATKDSPVQFTLPTQHGEGRRLSERRNFAIYYGHPISFDCGAESVTRMEQAGQPYYPSRIEVEILIQFKTLWFWRKLATAGPFVAVRVGDKYQWTEGETVKVEPFR